MGHGRRWGASHTMSHQLTTYIHTARTHIPESCLQYVWHLQGCAPLGFQGLVLRQSRVCTTYLQVLHYNVCLGQMRTNLRTQVCLQHVWHLWHAQQVLVHIYGLGAVLLCTAGPEASEAEVGATEDSRGAACRATPARTYTSQGEMTITFIHSRGGRLREGHVDLWCTHMLVPNIFFRCQPPLGIWALARQVDRQLVLGGSRFDRLSDHWYIFVLVPDVMPMQHQHTDPELLEDLMHFTIQLGGCLRDIPNWQGVHLAYLSQTTADVWDLSCTKEPYERSPAPYPLSNPDYFITVRFVLRQPRVCTACLQVLRQPRVCTTCLQVSHYSICHQHVWKGWHGEQVLAQSRTSTPGDQVPDFTVFLEQDRQGWHGEQVLGQSRTRTPCDQVSDSTVGHEQDRHVAGQCMYPMQASRGPQNPFSLASEHKRHTLNPRCPPVARMYIPEWIGGQNCNTQLMARTIIPEYSGLRVPVQLPRSILRTQVCVLPGQIVLSGQLVLSGQFWQYQVFHAQWRSRPRTQGCAHRHCQFLEQWRTRFCTEFFVVLQVWLQHVWKGWHGGQVLGQSRTRTPCDQVPDFTVFLEQGLHQGLKFVCNQDNFQAPDFNF